MIKEILRHHKSTSLCHGFQAHSLFIRKLCISITNVGNNPSIFDFKFNVKKLYFYQKVFYSKAYFNQFQFTDFHIFFLLSFTPRINFNLCTLIPFIFEITQ